MYFRHDQLNFGQRKEVEIFLKLLLVKGDWIHSILIPGTTFQANLFEKLRCEYNRKISKIKIKFKLGRQNGFGKV